MYFLRFVTGNDAYRMKRNLLQVYNSKTKKVEYEEPIFCKSWTNRMRNEIEQKSKTILELFRTNYHLSDQKSISRMMDYYWIKKIAFNELEHAISKTVEIKENILSQLEEIEQEKLLNEVMK